jgi:hypothetical protein
MEGTTTVREHLRQVELSGREVPELHPEPPPDEIMYIWDWFMQLSRSRPVGMGPGAISFSEIRAWADLMGEMPTRTETKVLMMLDEAFLRSRQ